MAWSAPNCRQALHLSSLPAVAITMAPAGLRHLDRRDPMPLVPPCTSRVSPGCRRAAVEHVGPNGEKRSREGSPPPHRSTPLDVGRHWPSRARCRVRRNRLPRPRRRPGHRLQIGRAAARIARRIALDDHPRDLEPRQVGRSGGTAVRCTALALQHVGPVHTGQRRARGINTSPTATTGARALGQAQHLGRARAH